MIAPIPQMQRTKISIPRSVFGPAYSAIAVKCRDNLIVGRTGPLSEFAAGRVLSLNSQESLHGVRPLPVVFSEPELPPMTRSVHEEVADRANVGDQ